MPSAKIKAKPKESLTAFCNRAFKAAQKAGHVYATFRGTEFEITSSMSPERAIERYKAKREQNKTKRALRWKA